MFYGSRADIRAQIGNAVPPPLARAVGKAIVRALSADAARGWVVGSGERSGCREAVDLIEKLGERLDLDERVLCGQPLSFRRA
jgi:hypothetical protein